MVYYVYYTKSWQNSKQAPRECLLKQYIQIFLYLSFYHAQKWSTNLPGYRQNYNKMNIRNRAILNINQYEKKIDLSGSLLKLLSPRFLFIRVVIMIRLSQVVLDDSLTS